MYHTRIIEAKELDLIGFGLSSFREDYANSFRDFAAAKKVRILVLDPDFPDRALTVASLRDLEEGNQAGRIAGDVRHFIEAVRPIAAEFPETFQVRLMRALPAINYFRIDDALFWGPYLIGSQSRNTPTLLLSRGGYPF